MKFPNFAETYTASFLNANPIFYFMPRIIYPSKLLLFGEHIVLKGGQALALPLSDFGGSWQYGGDAMDLEDWKNYLEDLAQKKELLAPINVQHFQRTLAMGLYFDSNIPTGYGLGSSGALCAGLMNVFKQENIEITNDLNSLKQQLAQLESFFHGKSSGIDPLVSYLNQPLLITQSNIQKVEQPSSTDDYQLFLLDTGIARQTAPWVNLFLKKCKTSSYLSAIKKELLPTNEAAVDAYLNGKNDILLEKWKAISAFQLNYFEEFIPRPFRSIWKAGLQSGIYAFKLCGAGGGGFLLGMTTDFEATERLLIDYSVRKVL